MAKNPPRPDELPSLLTNVAYETEVLAWSLHQAAALEHDAEVRRIYQVAIDRSAYIDAALAHTRNLIAFFTHARWKDGTPIASDYVAGWSAPPVRSRVLGVANDQALHIGIVRVRNPQQVDFAEVADDIDSCLAAFYDALPPELQPRCHASLAEALNAVTEPDKYR